ncbi:astakine-like isoform X2 [Nilaparvata lugens]|uniref:astakine-like isoform X2 n=1 Tax=Nilaparvata lugens TaxID=108931 RepID=UPI00193C94AE|nr:astakine-like isoform X2 [Nilaparvata lugens]
MKNLHVSLLLLSIGSFLLVETRPENRPGYIECQDSAECGSFACCVIGMDRYSSPRCMPHRREGNICRPASNTPQNKTISITPFEFMDFTNVHDIMCPCMAGLHCYGDGYSLATCIREQPTLFQNVLDASQGEGFD